MRHAGIFLMVLAASIVAVAGEAVVWGAGVALGVLGYLIYLEGR